jgi:hypothetical protein
MGLLVLTIIDTCAGLIFGLLALMLAIKASAILKTGGEFSVGWGPVKVGVGNAVVALFLIAAALIVACPLYLIYLSREDSPVSLVLNTAQLPADAQVPSVECEAPQYSDISAHLQVFRTSYPQEYQLTYGKRYRTVYVSASYDRPGLIDLKINDITHEVQINGDAASLDDAFQLTPFGQSKSASDLPLPITPMLLEYQDPAQQASISGGNAQ